MQRQFFISKWNQMQRWIHGKMDSSDGKTILPVNAAGEKNTLSKEIMSENATEFDELNFILCLCSDVLMDVVHKGSRHQLAKLERIGRRFHWLINNSFTEAPFLILNLKFIGGCFLDCDKANRFMPNSVFMTNDIPPFVRLATLRMQFCSWYGSGYPRYYLDSNSIEEQIKDYQALLPRLKSAVTNNTSLECFAGIKHDDSLHHFVNFSQLLKFIDAQFLQTFNFCSTIEVEAFTLTNESARTQNLYSFLETFFQLGPIAHSASVRLRLRELHHAHDAQTHDSISFIPHRKRQRIYKLPLEAIANWLQIIPSKSSINHSGRQQAIKKILRINMSVDPYELAEHLKKTFQSAKSPGQAYTIGFIGCAAHKIRTALLVNNETGEELSIDYALSIRKGDVTIKRRRIQTLK